QRKNKRRICAGIYKRPRWPHGGTVLGSEIVISIKGKIKEGYVQVFISDPDGHMVELCSVAK
ncbi:MAG: hypothetical protein EBT92_15900, partial [Planctomycetes bacterium]|nr:hypothetical protein [Planctomycetota bacterium]